MQSQAGKHVRGLIKYSRPQVTFLFKNVFKHYDSLSGKKPDSINLLVAYPG